MGLVDVPAVSNAKVITAAAIQVGSAKGINYRRLGPITTDITSIVQSATPDSTLTQAYTIPNSGALPANYPVDFGVALMNAAANAFGYIESTYPVLGGHLMSFYTDAPKIALKFGYCTSGYAYQVFVDGAPVTLDPVVGNGGLYLTMVFPTSGRARLIEIYTRSGIGTLYMATPFRAWKPKPRPKPKIIVVGDSYAMTTSYDSAGNALPYEYGIYHRMGADIGVPNMGVDGVGGSGYLQRNAGGVGGPNNNYTDRLSSTIALNPDVVVIHGGGANDLANGYTQAQVITSATSLFQTLRAALPNAKLVFVEGFSPPAFFTYQAGYVAISAALRTALVDTGVYYIDVATTAPWLTGSGYFGSRVVTDGVLNSTTTLTSSTAAFTSLDVGVYITGTGIPAGAKIASVTNGTTVVLTAAATATASGVSVTITRQKGDGNSDIYVGPDATHLLTKGSDYIRSRMADRLRVVLLDNGELLNTLI